MKTHVLRTAAMILFYCSSNLLSQGSAWDSVDTILHRIIPPVFPNKEFNISTYGALGDGTTDCTTAIKNAINDCSSQGGGKVVVPSGTFLTGAIYLKSNVNLYLSFGATLLFSKDKAKYLPIVYTRFEGIECMNYSPFIYSFEETNIAITGSGTLDGQADNTNWWDWKNNSSYDSYILNVYASTGTPVVQRIFGTNHYLRPNFIQPYKCKNILIEGIKIIRSPMWEVHPVLCKNVTVRNIAVDSYGPNNDGCNPECCSDVLIQNCSFNTGDDCIAIKSGKNDDGRRVNTPSQNIIIKDCNMIDGHGGITMGSEMTGGIRNVFAENCTMNGTNLNIMLRFKTNTARGGIIENIYIRNITELMDMQGSIHIEMFYNNETGSYLPIIRNIFVNNITSSQSFYALYIHDDVNFPVTNIKLTDCTFNNSRMGYILGNAKQVIFKNVNINGNIYTKIDENKSIDTEFRLHQNYPNPFNPETNIKYELKNPGHILLKVYDLLGNEIATLVNEYKPAGTHSAQFSIHERSNSASSKLSSGLYFYKLLADGKSAVRKMIILK